MSGFGHFEHVDERVGWGDNGSSFKRRKISNSRALPIVRVYSCRQIAVKLLNALNFRFVPRDIDARISRVDLICAGWGSDKIAQSDMNRDVRWRLSDGNSRLLSQCSHYQIFMSG